MPLPESCPAIFARRPLPRRRHPRPLRSPQFPLSLAFLFFALAFAVSSTADDCMAPCGADGRACVCVVDPADLEVRRTPLGGIEHTQAGPGSLLAIGDELVGADEGGIVELLCPGGSRVKLIGRFRAVVIPRGEGHDCAFNLLAGAADVLTDQPTRMESGEVVMGSLRTWYGIRVTRQADAPRVEALVFEGEVAVRGPAAGGTWDYRLVGGNQVLWSGGTDTDASVRLAPVMPQDFAHTALVQARTDVARLQVRPDPPASQEAVVIRNDLARLYGQVLVRPDDLDARLQLADIQTRVGRPSLALYQLDRAAALQPTRIEDRTAISVQRWETYRVIGQDESAEREAENIRRLDPSVYQRLQVDDTLLVPPAQDEIRGLRLDTTPLYLHSQ